MGLDALAMDKVSPAFLTLLAILLTLAVTSIASAEEEEVNDVFLLEAQYLAEGTTNSTDIELNGQTIVQAWFNFTVLEDNLNSQADSFVFTVRNLDDPAVTQSLPGTTDTQGRINVNLPFTRRNSNRWSVVVSCSDAGDVMFGPVVLQEDPGNDWSLQVDYLYVRQIDGPNGNGNGNGNGGGGGDDRPALVTVFEVNMMAVALMGLLVAFLAFMRYRGGGQLKLPYAFGLVILVDSFFAMPIAMLINQEQNGAAVSTGPFGAEWLGNLALILFIVWLIPVALARKKLMTSEATHSIFTKVIGEGVADRIRSRGEGLGDDPLSERTISLLVTLVGLITVALVALMLLI
jgi:hypothetical protein